MRNFRFLVLAVTSAFITSPACFAASQRPITELKPIATFKLGKTADWVAIAPDAVWVASTGPFALNRIDPKSNTQVATVKLPASPCAGLAVGAGSLWVPLCSKKKPSLAKIDLLTSKVAAIFPVGPPAEEGGVAFGEGSVWLIIDKLGNLARIDPANGAVLATVHVPADSYNPVYSEGMVWVSHAGGSDVSGVEAATAKLLATVATGPHPRFLAAGAGAVWTLNQGDGTLTRINARTHESVTIALKTPGHGGDIALGDGKIWTTMPKVPLSLVDAAQAQLECQWTGPGGDSMNLGFGGIWLTDYYAGTIARYAVKDVLANCRDSQPVSPAK